MNAMTYVPEIDLMLRSESYALLVQRAEADLNASHQTLALCDAVTMLESDVETKDKELEEAYAEHGRLEGVIAGKDDDVDKLRDEVERLEGVIAELSEQLDEARATTA